MKYNQLLLIFIFFISFLYIGYVNCNFRKNKKVTSQSSRFIAYFLRGMGIKNNVKILSIKADKICPQFRKAHIFVRINKIKSGLKKLKKLRKKSSGKRRKYYRNIGKVHILIMLRHILKRINKCSLVPVKIASNIQRFLKTSKLIIHKKCNNYKKCNMFNFRKLNRVYRFLNANIAYAHGTKTRKNRKETSRNQKKNGKQGRHKIQKRQRGNGINRLKTRINKTSQRIAKMLASIVKNYIKRNYNKRHLKSKKLKITKQDTKKKKKNPTHLPENFTSRSNQQNYYKNMYRYPNAHSVFYNNEPTNIIKN